MTIDDPRARREVRLDGARVVYSEAGAGEPVVFFHGYPQSRLCWRHQFEAFARTHRVIAADWLGWGESDRPLELSFFYDEEVTRLGRLLDALGLGEANVVAHDYGAHLSLGFAARHSERITRLVVLNSRAHRTFPLGPWLLFGATGVAARTPVLRALLERSPIAGFHRALVHRYLANGSFDRALLARYLGWMSTPAGRKWFVRFWQDYRLREPDIRDGLGRFDAPVAIVWGDRDAYCPPWIADELARLLPRATVQHLPDADHYVMEERPADVTSAIRRFLADSATEIRVSSRA